MYVLCINKHKKKSTIITKATKPNCDVSQEGDYGIVIIILNGELVTNAVEDAPLHHWGSLNCQGRRKTSGPRGV